MKWVLSSSQKAALKAIRNFVIHQGRFPSVRELMAELDFSSPRSAAYLLERLKAAGAIKERRGGGLQLASEPADDAASAQTVEVPIVGTASCGSLMLAEENIESYLPVSTRLAPPAYKHFILRAQGDSMDQAGIASGDLVLVRQQSLASDGDRVVALVNDEATIKELHLQKDAVVLKPRSSNSRNRPIVLSRDFQIQGVVVAAFPDPAALAGGKGG